MHVDGDLTLVGNVHPLSFDITFGDDGALSATAVITQSDWGIKPYSALFGTLKVIDDIEITVEGRLPARDRAGTAARRVVAVDPHRPRPDEAPAARVPVVRGAGRLRRHSTA